MTDKPLDRAKEAIEAAHASAADAADAAKRADEQLDIAARDQLEQHGVTSTAVGHEAYDAGPSGGIDMPRGGGAGTGGTTND